MELGFGIAGGPDAEALAGLAAELERLGFDSAWANDNPSGEGLEMLAGWAGHSRAIDLGVGVLALDRHRPAEIAARVAELAVPKERLLLGVGAGFSEHPAAAVRAGVEAVREALPGVRVVVAAMGPRMCALAGEVGDAVLLNWMTPERAAWARERVREGEEKAGRETGTVRVYGYVRAAVGPDASERLRRESLWYAQAPHYARHFAAMGREAHEVGEACEDARRLSGRLAAYSALDVVVVRALAERGIPDLLAVAKAAIGAA
jgi:alkanesulfonate monooxygenase SsuD/methylene tetrahydromethanopterin reductase-like flavin-dependent oxidoreductase (luciferase family)